MQIKQTNRYSTLTPCPSCATPRMVRNGKHRESKLCRKCAYKKCCSRERRLLALNPSYRGSAHIPQSRFTNWKNNADRRGIAWRLTIEDIERLWEMQQGRCALTGRRMRIAARGVANGGDSDDVLSLDRIDPQQCYDAGNVQLVVWEINRVKNDLSDSELLALCREVLSHRRAVDESN